MGELIDGVWHRSGIDRILQNGEMRRPPSTFRNWITAEGEFPAAAGRYHVYVSLACPWAHRTLILHRLKGLQGIVGLSVVHWLMGDEGWTFDPAPGVIPDTVNGATALHQIYTRSDPACTTRVTVPVLWDRVSGKIVSNESSEILRMFNSAFDGCGAEPGDYSPATHLEEIDEVNARVYATVNNGVYRAGFAKNQAAYEAAVTELFNTLEWLDARLTHQRYLVRGKLTEADIRLFTTLVRFDQVYHGHFKCNLRTLKDYPALWAFTRDLFQHPAIGPTVDFDHIKRHYYSSHLWLNPSGIVPLGPVQDFYEPSGREKWLGLPEQFLVRR